MDEDTNLKRVEHLKKMIDIANKKLASLNGMVFRVETDCLRDDNTDVNKDELKNLETDLIKINQKTKKIATVVKAMGDISQLIMQDVQQRKSGYFNYEGFVKFDELGVQVYINDEISKALNDMGEERKCSSSIYTFFLLCNRAQKKSFQFFSN